MEIHCPILFFLNDLHLLWVFLLSELKNVSLGQVDVWKIVDLVLISEDWRQ